MLHRSVSAVDSAESSANKAPCLLRSEMILNVPLFSNLGEEVTRRLCMLFQPYAAVRDELIVIEGEVGRELFVVIHGQVSVSDSPSRDPTLLPSPGTVTVRLYLCTGHNHIINSKRGILRPLIMSCFVVVFVKRIHPACICVCHRAGGADQTHACVPLLVPNRSKCGRTLRWRMQGTQVAVHSASSPTATFLESRASFAMIPRVVIGKRYDCLE